MGNNNSQLENALLPKMNFADEKQLHKQAANLSWIIYADDGLFPQLLEKYEFKLNHLQPQEPQSMLPKWCIASCNGAFYLCYRGTQKIGDIAGNIGLHLSQYYSHSKKCELYMFTVLSQALLLQAPIIQQRIEKILQENPGSPWIFCGHSAGGCHAAAFCYYVSDNSLLFHHLQCVVTFGSPTWLRAEIEDAAKVYVTACHSKVTNYVIPFDPIPQLFCHDGVLYFGDMIIEQVKKHFPAGVVSMLSKSICDFKKPINDIWSGVSKQDHPVPLGATIVFTSEEQPTNRTAKLKELFMVQFRKYKYETFRDGQVPNYGDMQDPMRFHSDHFHRSNLYRMVMGERPIQILYTKPVESVRYFGDLLMKGVSLPTAFGKSAVAAAAGAAVSNKTLEVFKFEYIDSGEACEQEPFTQKI